ncbi:cobalt-precorrin-7 (C(5))-methyltransferase [Acidianus manzaensis]|uniref:Precorrin-6y C5,15-methyltransferase (Decarboxylating) subunit CbiE n=1 Tax=Acidianus manzaensis TaxID=282676 RepID=A0A1W6JX34_9CREN|nr:cobalt-precorrin-7 (C(5))-methyltransferase [Acidianus manzaensis]ARM74774.1 precorrin-6y C5,15-methyltransferase (decarboxylating) subunit CbiE [Acidianus manzaensis]
MIYVIGVGPGDPELISEKALKIINKAEVITGWKSVIERFNFDNEKKKEVIPLNYKEEKNLLEIVFEKAKNKEVAFLDHGDPSVSDFELMSKLRDLSRKYNVKISFIPGISSVLASLAYLGIDLSKVIFITYHVRGPTEDIKKYLNCGRDLLIIPSPYPDGVVSLAKELEKNGCGEGKITVMQKLTYPDQIIKEYKVKELSNSNEKFSDLTIVYVSCGDKNE